MNYPPKACHPATFSHTNPLKFPFQYLNCCQILYSNATDLELGSSTYFFMLYSFLVFTKCQVLNLRVGRSRDQVLQSTFGGYNIHTVNFRVLSDLREVWYWLGIEIKAKVKNIFSWAYFRGGGAYYWREFCVSKRVGLR